MKAIVVNEFGAPEVLKLGETADLKPAAAQVSVEIKAAGVNPVDTYIRGGNYAQKPNLPYTPGKDGAGIVAAVGADVSKFKVGDRVLIAQADSGTYAEFCLCDEKKLIRLPENASFEQGAGVFVTAATAYRALFQKAHGVKGETVLIHGASGGVGLAAVQWAKNAGMTVIGTASSDAGKRLVREQGADFVFDHTDIEAVGQTSAAYLDEILDATNGAGVNVILEMLANENLVKDFEVLAQFGRICVIGSRGSLEFDPRLLMGKDASIAGLSLFNAPQAEMSEIYAAIDDGLREGFLSPTVGKTFALKDAAQAHHAIIEEKSSGKIVLIV